MLLSEEEQTRIYSRTVCSFEKCLLQLRHTVMHLYDVMDESKFNLSIVWDPELMVKTMPKCLNVINSSDLSKYAKVDLYKLVEKLPYALSSLVMTLTLNKDIPITKELKRKLYMKFIENYLQVVTTPFDCTGILRHEYERVKATILIQRACHNWLYSCTTADGQEGIKIRLCKNQVKI